MACRKTTLPNGIVMISCGRPPKEPCFICGAPMTKYCDACDVPICDAHSVGVGPDTDVCPKHTKTADIEKARRRRKAYLDLEMEMMDK